jgi:hypothetical protein
MNIGVGGGGGGCCLIFWPSFGNHFDQLFKCLTPSNLWWKNWMLVRGFLQLTRWKVCTSQNSWQCKPFEKPTSDQIFSILTNFLNLLLPPQWWRRWKCWSNILTVLLNSAWGQSPMIKLLQTLSSENFMSSAGGSPWKTQLHVTFGMMQH